MVITAVQSTSYHYYSLVDFLAYRRCYLRTHTCINYTPTKLLHGPKHYTLHQTNRSVSVNDHTSSIIQHAYTATAIQAGALGTSH